MTTLLMRLAAPLQSWGTASKFNSRGTEKEPSKSGVIGMVASAMGLSRDSDISMLSVLRFGVRIDQPGRMIRDFHTVSKNGKSVDYITERFYLADAVFLVGLEGDGQVLETADAALRRPKYPLFLGRRSCPPSGKVSLGIREGTLEESLASEPWQASEWFRGRIDDDYSLDLMLESEGSSLVSDQPVSFSQDRRVFGLRGVEYRGNAVKVFTRSPSEDLEERPVETLSGQEIVKGQRRPMNTTLDFFMEAGGSR